MMKRCINEDRIFIYLPNFTNYRASAGDIGLVMHVDACEFFHDGNDETAISRIVAQT